ncbi:MAG: uroporphyrinogen-III synthase [Actinomycetes bacterium]
MVDPPLAGFTVGITADRRRDELESLLVRRGARVFSGPALRILPVAEDDQLMAVTKALVATPPDVLVANTGVGFRGWVEAADGWGLLEPLLQSLGGARTVVRGPKAAGAVRAAGLREEWSPPAESSDEVLAYLLERGVAGLRIAVQLHGEPQTAFCSTLREAGADVVEAPVYRWVAPHDRGPLLRLLDGILAGEVDALAFTSAPAVVSLLHHAGERREALVRAMRRDVVVACVGPVCARPLVAEGVPSVLPERMRLGGLVRALTEAMPARAERVDVRGRALEVRGHAAFIDGVRIDLGVGPLAVLRVLVRARGAVVPREALLAQLPGGGTDAHAVETTVSRLRAALGDGTLVRTVVKRGYRLDTEPA